MLVYTWTYTNFKGEQKEITETFNLNKVELTNMQISKDGGLDKVIEKAIANKDAKVIIPLWQEIIKTAYGKMTEDGEHFYKKDPETGKEYWKDFEQTASYEGLYMELFTDAKKAADFLKGIVPKFDLTPEQQKIIDNNISKISNNQKPVQFNK